MKRFSQALLSISAAAAMLLPGTSAFAADEETDMRTDLTAQQAAEEMGIGWNLGNTMEAYDAAGCEKITYEWIPRIGDNTPSDYETCWGAPVTTQEMIDGVKAAGFSTVRIPVFWGNMMENDGSWTISSDYIGRVKEIVDYCLNDDLYAVVNIHHFDEFIIRRNGLEDCAEIFDGLWTQIAEHFKDYPDRLVFEGFNEYLGAAQFNESGELEDMELKDAYELTNRLNQTFVDAVRSTGGNNAERVLIVSGLNTNIDRTTASRFVMPQDTAENKLMVSVHYVDNMMYWINAIGGSDWKNYAKDQCELLKKAFTSKGIPVFMGETTSRYPADRFAWNATVKTSSECLEYILGLLDDYGFVPVLWDVTDNFYDRTACVIKDEADAKVISVLAGISEPDDSDESSESEAESSDISSEDESSETSEPEDVSSEAAPDSASDTSAGSTSKGGTAGSSSNPNTGAAAALLGLTAVAGVAAVLHKKDN